MCGVDRTTVPETAVDENGDPRGAEDDIGRNAQIRYGSAMNSEPKTHSMQSGANQQLG
jgi:hypothetical protein